MASNTHVFFLGATGYIGGAVLTRLLAHPAHSRLSVTALVRSPEKAARLERFGVRAVTGSLQDTSALVKLAADADVVIACADADDLPAAQAIIEGMERRKGVTGKAPVLIHTSGTGVFGDSAAGMHSTDIIYYDTNPEQIETLPRAQPHRVVDLAVVDADSKGTVRAYIVLPSTIWGLAQGPLAEAGIMNPRSQQIPNLIRASLDRSQAGMVGEGKNVWPNVSIDEVGDLYMLIFDSVLEEKSLGHGREGFYIGENGEHLLYDICRKIGTAMVGLGKADTEEVRSFSKEELNKYFGGSTRLGSNVRCRGERSRAIGWSPVKTTEDMLASIRRETESMLQVLTL